MSLLNVVMPNSVLTKVVMPNAVAPKIGPFVNPIFLLEKSKLSQKYFAVLLVPTSSMIFPLNSIKNVKKMHFFVSISKEQKHKMKLPHQRYIMAMPP
jgi:hypothetical protein